jgi:L-seryl-tRNA(Ser) seleniumtransferase
MIASDVLEVRVRARGLAERLSARGVVCEVVDTAASIGGGSFPTARIPSCAVALRGDAQQIDVRLRAGEPPVISRILDGRVLLDLRTIPLAVDDELAAIVQRAIA